ncbi:hypothetical protein ACUNGE_19675, partial [Serratia sp. IR-2025]
KIAIGLNTLFREHSMENTPKFSLGDFHIVNIICFVRAHPHRITTGYCQTRFGPTVMSRNTSMIHEIFFYFSMPSLQQKTSHFLMKRK